MNRHQNLNIQENIDVKSKAMTSRMGKSNRGAAMIVVVCVMAVVMILSLTLLMAAYQMLATVGDEGRDDHYYQQAVSFSEVVRARLERKLETTSAGGGLTDELTGHIDDFMKDDTKDKEILEADAPASGGAYGGITIVLDKSISSNNGKLLITISVNEGDKVMASCKSKYEVKESSGVYSYRFCEYY